ncbi:MAG: ABC transporter permease [Acidobacteriia bacterium]|nr:ABC transporter permease [Terriglobia bacterium]
MLQDFVFGLKILGKQRAFTAAALLTLALCIGANTAIFTVLENVVLRGLPFPDAGRLVTMYNVYPGVGVERGSNGIPDYLDRRKLKNVFSEVALIGYTGYEVGMEGSPQRIDGRYVTPSFFTVLGVKPLLGRTFTEEEAVLGKEKVAILTEGLWKDLFARDRNVVGKDIRLSGTLYRIVGVMPASFGIPGDEARVYTSFAFTPEQTSDKARHNNNWGMVARLKPGVTLAQAQGRIDDLNRRNLDIFPEYRQLLINARFGSKVVALKDDLVHDVRSTVYLLQIAVGVVLLIGCVNLANLMLVRSNVRMKELAIRYSLGAGRWRIARQLLTESVLLAFLGGVLGIAVGYGGVRLLASLGAKDLPRGVTIGVDAGALGFTALIAFVTGMIFGSVPLIHVLRSDLNEVFRGNERGGTAGHAAVWVRSALVVSQFALAFVLLIGAGLLTMSFSRLLKVNPGFRVENAVAAQISLPRTRYGDDAVARNFLAGMVERVGAIPGVRAAGLTTYLPFSGNNNSSVVEFPSRPLGPGEPPPVPGFNQISGGYLHAMGIPLLQGRTFSDSDGPDAPKVAIIDDFLARRYFPRGNAVGAKVHRGIQEPGGGRKPDECTIVGVAGIVKTSDLAEANPVGQIYFSYKQYTPRNIHLVLRAARENPQIFSTVRRELQRADPELPLYDTKTMAERVTSSLQNRRAAMMLCLVFAGLALLLAAIGIYGVLAYSVSQRTREFGIRVALGAGSRELVGMVVGQGLRMAALGLALGAAGALALTRLMTTLLFDVKPSDPSLFVAVAAALAVVAGAASLIPSARALSVPPGSALRVE